MVQLNPCDLCGRDDFKLRYRISKLRRIVVQCKGCGLFCVNPKDNQYLTIDFENRSHRKIKQEHIHRFMQEAFGLKQKNILDREEKWRQAHFKTRLTELYNYRTTGKLLDVGCSLGHFLSIIPRDKFDIYGVEPSEFSSSIARQKVGTKIFCGTLKEANYADSYFDIVTLINVLEHLSSPREGLQEINRIMKTGGILLIETPDMGSWVPKVLGKWWPPFLELEHHFFFSRLTIRQLLANSRFEIIKIKKAYKLFSLRYLVYQATWYNKKLAGLLVQIVETLRIADRLVRVPQPDEMMVFAIKTDQ